MTLPWKVLIKIISTVFILAVLASPFALKIYLHHLPFSKAQAQESICAKLGLNLAVTTSDPNLLNALSTANSVKSQFTEILVTGVGANDLANVLNAINANNQQTIIRLGAGRNSENISAGDWANFLNTVNTQSNKPVIATAGHNEPYCAEARSLQEESQYIQTVAGGTDADVTLLTGQLDIYCPRNSSGPDQNEYFRTISNINGIDAIAMPFYTEVGGQNIDATVALFQNYANLTNKPIYITEVGADPNNEGTGDPTLLREALNRILGDNQILAALVFNGLCQNTDPTFAYTQNYCSPECLPLISGCFGSQNLSEAELTALATQCQAGITEVFPQAQTEDLYIHPENLGEIEQGYKLTCGNAPATGTNFVNTFLCQQFGLGCTTNLTETVEHFLRDKDIPWWNLERNEPLIRSGSMGTFWSADFDDPTVPQDFDAPLIKATTPEKQCQIKLEYLQHIDRMRRNQQTANQRSIVPRLLPGTPYLDEVDFYVNRIRNRVNCSSYPSGLSGIDRVIFDAIIPQVGDGREFKVAYLVNYIEKPEGLRFDITNPDPLIEVVRFLVPVTNVASQANQSEYPDTEFIESYIDSPMTRTANFLRPRESVERVVSSLHGARVAQQAGVNSASYNGPIIDAEELCSQITPENELKCKLAQYINYQNTSCPSAQSGEQATIPVTDARFFFENAIRALKLLPLQVIGSLVQQITATLDPRAQGEDVAQEQNFIIAPEETLLANQLTQQTLVSAFYPADKWAEFSQKIPDYSLVLGQNTRSNDPFSTFWLNPIIGAGLATANQIIDFNLFGNPFAPTQLAGNFVRPRESLGSLHNSPCEGATNESECYWKSNWQPQTTLFSTPSQIPPGSPNLPPVPQGTCIAPQPEEALSLIQQAQSDPQKYPYAHLVDADVLKAIYTIEGFTYYATSNRTCTKNTFNALGLMQVTDPTYQVITTESERPAQEEGICAEIPGKLNRCNPLDTIELGARALIFSKYGFLPNPSNVSFGLNDVYDATSNYYGIPCPDIFTRNLAEGLQLQGKISSLRSSGTDNDMGYPDIICGLLGTCPPYPPRQGC